jgi:hypothetical protein
MSTCIVCETEGAEALGVGDSGGSVRFDCRRCGSFVLSGTAKSTLTPKLNERGLRHSLMSHTLRRMQRPGDKHLRVITDDELPTFWRNERLPTPQQQADSGSSSERPYQICIGSFANCRMNDCVEAPFQIGPCGGCAACRNDKYH